MDKNLLNEEDANKNVVTTPEQAEQSESDVDQPEELPSRAGNRANIKRRRRIRNTGIVLVALAAWLYLAAHPINNAWGGMPVGTSLMWGLGILFFLFIISVSIGLHEAGHMVVARWSKVSVPTFSVGMGKSLFSRTSKRSGTSYQIAVLPIGGYVRLVDEKVKPPTWLDVDAWKKGGESFPTTQKDDVTVEQKKEYEKFMTERSLLSHIHPFKRIAIFFAGPAVNLVLGTLILMATLFSFQMNLPSESVNKTLVCQGAEASCGAANAGIESGDKIVSINGETVIKGDISGSVAGKSAVDILVERNGQNIEFKNVRVVDGKIGVMMGLEKRHASAPEVMNIVGNAVNLSIEGIKRIPEKFPAVLKNIVGGERDADTPSSMIAVGKQYGDTASNSAIPLDSKFSTLFLYAGLVNLGLGFLNLLPIGMLDGGRIAFAVVDWLKMGVSRITRREYKPLGHRFVTGFITATAILIFAAMSLFMLSDLLSWFRGQI